MGRSTQEHSSSVEHQPSQGEDEEIPHSGRMNNLRSSKSKGMETAWLVRSCGKKKIILDGEEYKKPITEYRKPSGRTDNLRSSRNYQVESEHRKPSGRTGNPRQTLHSLKLGLTLLPINHHSVLCLDQICSTLFVKGFYQVQTNHI